MNKRGSREKSDQCVLEGNRQSPAYAFAIFCALQFLPDTQQPERQPSNNRWHFWHIARCWMDCLANRCTIWTA